ncbi:fucolectin-like [Magallana gigas]|uniref:fucolectin-like n=1 Tax=Magallana gigas TaxID=29159 RepID=UPI003340BC4D
MGHFLIGKYLNEVAFTTALLCVVSLYEGVTSAVVPGERYRGPVVRVLEIIGQQQYVRESVSNLALHKPAKQSSTFIWAEAGLNYSANLAVDGNNGTDFVVDRCASTEGGDTNPWWRLDLQAVYSIRSVRIFNRGMDEWGQDVSDRLRNVTVTVGLTGSDVNTPCGFFAGPGTLSQYSVIFKIS